MHTCTCPHSWRNLCYPLFDVSISVFSPLSVFPSLFLLALVKALLYLYLRFLWLIALNPAPAKITVIFLSFLCQQGALGMRIGVLVFGSLAYGQGYQGVRREVCLCLVLSRPRLVLVLLSFGVRCPLSPLKVLNWFFRSSVSLYLPLCQRFGGKLCQLLTWGSHPEELGVQLAIPVFLDLKKKKFKNMILVFSSVRMIFNNSKAFRCLTFEIHFCLQIYWKPDHWKWLCVNFN